MALAPEFAAHLANPVLAPLNGVGTQGYGENAACGDELWFEVGDLGGPADARLRYRVVGCAALVAGASLWVAAVRAAADPLALDVAAVLAAAGGLPARSGHVAGVIERAWRAATARARA